MGTSAGVRRQANHCLGRQAVQDSLHCLPTDSEGSISMKTSDLSKMQSVDIDDRWLIQDKRIEVYDGRDGFDSGLPPDVDVPPLLVLMMAGYLFYWGEFAWGDTAALGYLADAMNKLDSRAHRYAYHCSLGDDASRRVSELIGLGMSGTLVWRDMECHPPTRISRGSGKTPDCQASRGRTDDSVDIIRFEAKGTSDDRNAQYHFIYKALEQLGKLPGGNGGYLSRINRSPFDLAFCTFIPTPNSQDRARVFVVDPDRPPERMPLLQYFGIAYAHSAVLAGFPDLALVLLGLCGWQTGWQPPLALTPSDMRQRLLSMRPLLENDSFGLNSASRQLADGKYAFSEVGEFGATYTVASGISLEGLRALITAGIDDLMTIEEKHRAGSVGKTDGGLLFARGPAGALWLLGRSEEALTANADTHNRRPQIMRL